MNTEEHTLNGKHALLGMTVILGVAIIVAVFWVLLKPAFAESAASTNPVENALPLVWHGSYLLTGTGGDNPHLAGDAAQPLDCVSCHNQPLTFHDKLGEGSQACYNCHVSTDTSMSTFKHANGSIILKADSSRLCGQCHQERYEAWSEGTHGIPGTVAAVPCVACHNPHRPQVQFENITKPPLSPVHTPPPLHKDWVIIIGISVACLLVGAVVLARRRENP